ncbi:MAG: wax ester/triacylglycerol synthase family O-acyltransferase [Actinomycetota bacterium]|nr:wax ester/triacylglycerol synthase family O-acyltransferase [Actinomycetota bacterium]
MPESPYLSQNDTIMWMVEADPLLRSTIMGVVLLDRAPEWTRLRDRVEEVSHHIAALREKVVPVPLHPTTLRWVADPDFDLDYHLRRTRLPDGSDVQSLMDWARTTAMGGFDSARPLWEFTMVEGVAIEGHPDGAALVMKAHHVVTDGIGAVQLAAHLFDFEEAPGPARRTAAPAREHTGTGELLREVILHDVEGMLDFTRQQMKSAVPRMLHAVRHPQQAVAEAVGTAVSIAKFLAPTSTPKSTVMVGRMMSTNYRTVEVPVEHLHAASRAAGGRLNDGFLAGITAGLQKYHQHHGATVHELRVAMPISQRAADDPAGGNHVTVTRFTVPVDEATPAERIRDLHAVVDGIRHEKALHHTEAIAGALNLMPRGVVGTMLKGVDFLASNVPGVPMPIWLEGTRVLRFFPFGPTAGSAINVTLMSYDGTCCIGANMDAAAIPDPDVLADCLRAGFAEVCSLAAT